MADEVVFKDKLLSENEAEVDFSQQLVDEVVILPYEMIHDILKYGTNLSEGEHVILAELLRLSVILHVESQVLHWQARVGAGGLRVSECGKREVALVYHELEVVLPVLVVEDEVLLATHTEPVEEL